MTARPIWVASLVLLAALTVWVALFPSVDLTVAGWFYDPQGTEATRFWSNDDPPISWIYDGVQRGSQIWGVLLLVLLLLSLIPPLRWLQRHRAPIGFLFVALVLAPGLTVHTFKNEWPRPRPRDSQPFQGEYEFRRLGELAGGCQRNCSFPSGHAAFGAYLAAPAFIHRRRRYTWALVGVGGALLVGLARIAVGGHWFSDVLFSYWIVTPMLAVSWLLAHPRGWQFVRRRLSATTAADAGSDAS